MKYELFYCSPSINSHAIENQFLFLINYLQEKSKNDERSGNILLSSKINKIFLRVKNY